MSKSQSLTRFVAIALVSALSGFAQDSSAPPTPPTPAQMVANRVSRLTTLLSLTSEQQTQATTIFTNEESALSDLRKSLHSAHSALRTAIENNDSSGIASQAAQIGSLTTQQVQGEATAQAAFYASLTADQQAKYKQLRSFGPGGFGGGPGHGPGGPH